jgi:hypothetical protein
MDLKIKLEHADPDRRQGRGWASLGRVLPPGWTRDDYNRIVKICRPRSSALGAIRKQGDEVIY